MENRQHRAKSNHCTTSFRPVLSFIDCPAFPSPAFSITSNYTEYASERLVWPSRQIQYRRTRSANTDADKYTRAPIHTHTYVHTGQLYTCQRLTADWLIRPEKRQSAPVVIIRRRRRYTGQKWTVVQSAQTTYSVYTRIAICTRARLFYIMLIAKDNIGWRLNHVTFCAPRDQIVAI